ncbi:uncharacterized protein LOC111042882 [Myzus persicae]|uniref:uncharacterized protein LOC111042882 n=1 Tax=Myzus persicae TaxID=13164 RepID=UPI000B93A092|nr:uncharacterized protein LOC111042882 [Myzus persicae]
MDKVDKVLKKQLRTDEPKTGARVCSCHFVEGKKENGPTILPHRPHQFGTHHLTPEKKRFRKTTQTISHNMLDIMADNEVLCENSDKINPIEYEINNDVLDLSLKPILNSSINKEDQILITLMKLRHNFPHFDLAVRFNCSSATITNIVITWINILHQVLFKKCMSKIPFREKNKLCMPNAFKPFLNCRIVIDCTEIFTAVSRQSMNIQKDTYSNYKHRNTWKALIGIAPNGVVTFVSKLFPGSTSDKVITLKSGLLEQLVPGDLILADKGFLIRDILPPGVSLNIPPFLDTPQFTPDQVVQTETIAKARIHIERAIQRIKCYSILDVIPFSMLKQAESIFQVVAALTNLQPPLIKEIQNHM